VGLVEERNWEKIDKVEERRKEERRSGILEIFGIDILGLVMFMCICLYSKESESP
jgi:hypothetical protein